MRGVRIEVGRSYETIDGHVVSVTGCHFNYPEDAWVYSGIYQENGAKSPPYFGDGHILHVMMDNDPRTIIREVPATSEEYAEASRWDML